MTISSEVLFATLIHSRDELPYARLLLESIREFGGSLAGCPVLFHSTSTDPDLENELTGPQVEVTALKVPDWLREVPFGDKVLAIARTEQETGPGSLIWLDLECLVVQPPLLFNLGSAFDTAVRPVHIRNVGLTADEPLDRFWRGITGCFGLEDIRGRVESFIDRQTLRTYFNTHGLSINPAVGIGQRWMAALERLIRNHDFMSTACRDSLHRLFLFQTVFSAVIDAAVEPARIRILPPEYNYPYNLHDRVPRERRAAALNDLVCFTFEGRSIHSPDITDIAVHEPLRSWLESRTGSRK